uniref:Uncharacterized protein n=1 Tax=Oryza meridionalis TaxID=40149 RepID=A0A0E0EQW7_9ORYZ
MFDELPDPDNVSPLRVVDQTAPASPGMCTPTPCSSGFCYSTFVGSALQLWCACPGGAGSDRRSVPPFGSICLSSLA